MEKDLQKKGYFNDPERFADLINGVICSGRYKELDEDAYDVIAEYTNMVDIMGVNQKEKKGDKVNLCGAIRQMIEEGIEQGIEQTVKVLIETCMEFGRTKDETGQRIVTKLEVSDETAKRYIEQYWH